MPATTAAAPLTREAWSAKLNVPLIWNSASVAGIEGISDLARQAGITRQGLRKVLCEGALPSWATLAAIATAVNVTPSDLVMWSRVR